jgi:hypothetical protein
MTENRERNMVLTAFDMIKKLHNSETATARIIEELSAKFNNGMEMSPCVSIIAPYSFDNKET